MARFITLCSSSSGNAAFLGVGNYGVLFDAGISAKRIKAAMTEAGLDPAFIRAVFVTHEHTDHIAGVRVLATQLGVPVYATRGTLAGMRDQNVMDGKFSYAPILPEGVGVGDMRITHFRTSHDSRESCGYIAELPDGRRVGICTDTGVVTPEMKRALAGCTLVLLESNYDDDMLISGFYTPPLKARIRSSVGHLSNDDCADTACSLLDLGTRYFVLGHLSRENNTPEKAHAATFLALTHMGAAEHKDYELTVAPVEGMRDYIVF